MSRGLGTLQRQVLDTLALYRELGSSLHWNAPPTRDLWDAGERALYENGRLVETWKLLRDTGADKTALSRALRTLERRGLAARFDGKTLMHPTEVWNHGKAAYAGITRDGLAEVAKRQQTTSAYVDTYEPLPGQWLPQ